MLELIVAIFALVLASVSLARAWVPPQTRRVIELEGRVADLEFFADETTKRITKRARTEGAETARAEKQSKAATTNALLEQARQVIDKAQADGASPGAEVLPMTRDTLRARFLA